MVTHVAKYLWVECDRVVLGEEVGTRLGAEDEIDDGVTFPPAFVDKLIIGLNRRQHDGANDERDEQSRDPFADIPACCATP